MRSTLLATALVLMATPRMGHSLVRELANCVTSDGSYAVEVYDSQEIGAQRTSHVIAIIRDSSGAIVASYNAEKHRGPRSASFGRPTYQDVSTGGQLFSLQGPSTNVNQYDLLVTINNQIISAPNLNCSIFEP